MLKSGWALTIYFCLSAILFLATSNTISAGIIYVFLLFPYYAIVLFSWWIFVYENRTRTIRIKYWVWSVVLVLQVLTILISPGNCYQVKGGNRCYSNLQILLTDVPRFGASDTSHWVLAENAFFVLVAAYGVAVLVGLSPLGRSTRN